MKFSTAILTFFITTVSSLPIKRNVDPNLIPQFGVTPGQNPTGTGDCNGINGIKIPCACPPNRQLFIDSLNANVAAGKAVHNPSVSVSFPSDNSKASQEARMNAAIVTLQNLNGPGRGCPAASTTFSAQLKAIQDGTSSPASVPPPASPTAPAVSKSAPSAASGAARSVASPSPGTPTTPTGKLDLAILDKLTPQFGVTPGKNPTGTGDCTGINNIRIPCSCPPDRTAFLQSLERNIAAGKATNNPSVKLTFPTDGSKQSQVTRIQAAIVTLQNLNGPGRGCPAASTTFSAQLKAAQDGTTSSSAASVQAPPSPAAPAASKSAAAPAASNSSAALAAPAGLDLATLDKLTPQFGVTPGQNPTGTGDCTGINNIKVPCSCPPDRTAFLQSLQKNIAAGEATNNPSVKLTFPTDSSKQSQVTRIQAAIVTLQNLNGPGRGCPAASTTFSAQLKAAQDGTSSSAASVQAPASPAAPAASKSAAAAPASNSPAPAPAAAPAGLDLATLDKLTPQFGVTPGQNPTGTGDCTGINNIKVPCSCPPDRTAFLQSLQKNIAAGEATNNPSVKLTFPTDGSKQSQVTRIQAAIVTLQNLHGSGQGCPAASTTFSAQLAAALG